MQAPAPSTFCNDLSIDITSDAKGYTLLISDLHLSLVQDRPLTDAFSRLIHSHWVQNAARVIILGDFFDWWIGDDVIEHLPPVMTALPRVLALLQQLSQSKETYFVRGNRDILVGPKLALHTGMTLVNSGLLQLKTPKQNYICLHGDELCWNDTVYQAQRARFVYPEFVQNLLAQPWQERMALASKLRKQSKKNHQQHMSCPHTFQVHPEAIAHTLQLSATQHMIHGHTHQPGYYSVETDAHRWVIPNWTIHQNEIHYGAVLVYATGIDLVRLHSLI